MHCGFVRIFFLSGSQEYEFFLYWSAMVVGVTASYSRHAAGHILFYLLYFTFYVLYFYLLYFSFSSWWQKTVFLLEQFWTSHLMFSGLALKSCVVWITKKRDIRDSIINLILQSFQNKTLKGTRFSAAKEVSGMYIHRDGLQNNPFNKKAEHYLFCFLCCPMIRIFKALLKFET